MYKLGKLDNSPIAVEFISYRKTKLVLENAKKLKGKNISITKDLCTSDRADNKKLATHMKEAKKKGLISYIMGNKLVIGEGIYTMDQLRDIGNSTDYQGCEKNRQEADSGPSTPNILKREKHLIDDLGSDEKLEEQENSKKSKPIDKTIKSKTTVIKTRSNNIITK